MTVALRLAWLWTCPRCKHRNVHDRQQRDPTDTERVEVGAGDDDDDGHMVHVPGMVYCGSCEAGFPAEGP